MMISSFTSHLDQCLEQGEVPWTVEKSLGVPLDAEQELIRLRGFDCFNHAICAACGHVHIATQTSGSLMMCRIHSKRK